MHWDGLCERWLEPATQPKLSHKYTQEAHWNTGTPKAPV